MLELNRIYWTRKSLHLGMLRAVAWFFAAGILAVTHSPISQRPTSLIDILRPIFDAALAAVAVPCLIFVALVAVSAVIRGSVVRRRDPLGRVLPSASTSKGNA